MSDLMNRLMRAADHARKAQRPGLLVDLSVQPEGIRVEAREERKGCDSVCNIIVSWAEIDQAVANILPGTIDRAVEKATRL